MCVIELQKNNKKNKKKKEKKKSVWKRVGGIDLKHKKYIDITIKKNTFVFLNFIGERRENGEEER